MQRRLRSHAKPTDVACVWRNLRPDQDNVKHAGAGTVDSAARSVSPQLQFARDEFFEFHHICGKFTNAFGCFLRRHRILIQ